VSNGLEYLDGAGCPIGWNICIELDQWAGIWAGILGLNWSGKGRNHLLKLEYLVGAGVKWAGQMGLSWSEMGW
jgi:hypothetical protein